LDCEQKEIRSGDNGSIHCKGSDFRLLSSIITVVNIIGLFVY
jgi:hypothetical protein